MERGLVLRYPAPGWGRVAFDAVFPGAHVVAFGSIHLALEAEDTGFEVRDCLIALGPSRHRIWLLRRPINAPNTVGQVLKTGTGALYIDGCRVSYQGEEDQASAFPGGRTTSRKVTGGGLGAGWKEHERGGFEAQQGGGRWPTNFVLVHHPGCRMAGTRQVRTGVACRSNGGGKTFGGDVPKPPMGDMTYAGAGGLETVPAWVCEPECMVAALDAQSGVLKSGPTKPGYVRQNMSTEKNRTAYKGGFGDDQLTGYGDEGGASRFYPQFRDEGELDAWLRRLILG